MTADEHAKHAESAFKEIEKRCRLVLAHAMTRAHGKIIPGAIFNYSFAEMAQG